MRAKDVRLKNQEQAPGRDAESLEAPPFKTKFKCEGSRWFY